MKFPRFAPITCRMAESNSQDLGREGVRYAIQELTEPKLLIVKSPS